MPQYQQYIVVNKALGMSAGKLGAQTAHAAVKGVKLYTSDEVYDEWDKTGHTKIVLEARDTAHLVAFREYAKSRGYESWLVIDEGRTEVAAHSPTVLGFGVLDKADRDVAHTFSDLRTYRDTIKVTLEMDR
jgi:PTH2 family peptidyl-tRNA hydrolase